MNLNIAKLTTAEKLQAMEILWDELCRNDKEIESPPWHGDILHQRENMLARGEDEFEDWKQAKNDIRKNIS